MGHATSKRAAVLPNIRASPFFSFFSPLIFTPFNMVPLVLLMVVFYFIIIRPQQKKAKELAALVETLKPGDRVLCNSGIVGSVVSVKDKNVTLRSADSKIEVLKSSEIGRAHV